MSSKTSTVTPMSCNSNATALPGSISESSDYPVSRGEEQYLAELAHIHRGILPIPATVEEWLSQSNNVLMQVCGILNIGSFSFDDILVNSELATVTNPWWGEMTRLGGADGVLRRARLLGLEAYVQEVDAGADQAPPTDTGADQAPSITSTPLIPPGDAQRRGPLSHTILAGISGPGQGTGSSILDKGKGAMRFCTDAQVIAPLVEQSGCSASENGTSLSTSNRSYDWEHMKSSQGLQHSSIYGAKNRAGINREEISQTSDRGGQLAAEKEARRAAVGQLEADARELCLLLADAMDKDSPYVLSPIEDNRIRVTLKALHDVGLREDADTEEMARMAGENLRKHLGRYENRCRKEGISAFSNAAPRGDAGSKGHGSNKEEEPEWTYPPCCPNIGHWNPRPEDRPWEVEMEDEECTNQNKGMEIEEEAAPLGGAEAAPAEESATPAVKACVEVPIELAEVVANAVKETVTIMQEATITPAVGEAPAAVALVEAPAAAVVAEPEAAPAGAQVPAAAASAGIIDRDPYLIMGAGTASIAALGASTGKSDWRVPTDHTSSNCNFDKVQQQVLDKISRGAKTCADMIGRGAPTRGCAWCGLYDHPSYLCNLYNKVRHHVLKKQSRGGGNSRRGASRGRHQVGPPVKRGKGRSSRAWFPQRRQGRPRLSASPTGPRTK